MSSDTYYRDRFTAICAEINLDAKKILENPPSILGSIVRQWMIGELDELSVKNSLKNLAIFNPNKYNRKP
jgi:hypothetical protein